jgi:hypothetical protein
VKYIRFDNDFKFFQQLLGYTIKNKIKLSSYIRKFRVEHI